MYTDQCIFLVFTLGLGSSNMYVVASSIKLKGVMKGESDEAVKQVWPIHKNKIFIVYLIHIVI